MYNSVVNYTAAFRSFVNAFFSVSYIRCYLTGCMTNLCSFFEIRWNYHLVNYFSDASFWNQCKVVAFKIFSCIILVFSCKKQYLTKYSTVISNEIPNELTIYIKLCQHVTTWIYNIVRIIVPQSQYFTDTSQLLYFKCRKN